jgi:hypothetical protein
MKFAITLDNFSFKEKPQEYFNIFLPKQSDKCQTPTLSALLEQFFAHKNYS